MFANQALSPNLFKTLPIEVIVHLFRFLSIYEIGKLSLMDKNFNQAATYLDLWRGKFSDYFPERFEELKNTSNLNWYNKFVLEFEKLKKTISELSKSQKLSEARSKEIFHFYSLIAEGKIDELLQTNIDVFDFCHYPILSNLLKIKNLTNIIFEIVVKHYCLNYKTDPKKIDINVKAPHGSSIFHWIAFCNLKDKIKELTYGSIDENNEFILIDEDQFFELLNQEDDHGCTPCFMAAKYGCIETLKHLCEVEEVDIHYTNHEEQQSPIFVAAENGHVECVKFLKEKGADLNALDIRENSVLHVAAENGHMAMVQYLTENDLDINHNNLFGESLLHTASIGGHVKIVEWLRNKDLPLDIMTLNHETLMHYAMRCKNTNNGLEVMKFLMENGLDFRKPDQRGITALNLAIGKAVKKNKKEALIFFIQSCINEEQKNVKMENGCVFGFFQKKMVENICKNIAAADALIAVLEGKAHSTILDTYKYELSLNQLGHIYQSIAPLINSIRESEKQQGTKRIREEDEILSEHVNKKFK